MMFGKFTERAQNVLKLSQEEALRLKHNNIGTEHILLGLIREKEGIAAKSLVDLGLDTNVIKTEVENLIGEGKVAVNTIHYTPRAKKVIELSQDEARKLSHNYVGTEHILLGLIREGEGVASRVLTNLEVSLNKARQQVLQLLGASESASSRTGRGDQAKSGRTPTLDSLANDLTASVGKTAVVEGLAHQIVSNEVPEMLKDKRVMTLDMGTVVAGTKYRGEFEDRLKKVMDEIKNAGNVILFIDELHTLIGAGGAEG